MSNDEKIAKLQLALKPVIDWYKNVEAQGEPDSSYLYDETYDQFANLLSRDDFKEIVELLK